MEIEDYPKDEFYIIPETVEKIIEQEVTHMFEQILDFVQVVCPVDNWKAMRSKILRIGNNCIRKCHSRVNKLKEGDDLSHLSQENKEIG